MSLSPEKLFCPSSNSADTIVASLYHPSVSPRGVVQISHGMCEYKERYEDFARFLKQQGFAVCIGDHLGHGETARDPAHYGYFASQNGDQYLVNDLYGLTCRMKKRFPGLPIILLGHSMGSFIARVYLSKYSDAVQGAILCGTAGRNPLIRTAHALARMEQKRISPLGRSKLLSSLAFYRYNSRCTPHRTPYDWLTHDEEIVARYCNDPKCSFTFTVSGFADLFRLHDKANQGNCMETVRKDLPLFLIAGEQDPVGAYGKGVREVYSRFQSAGIHNLTLKLYAEGRHEILNECNRQEVYEDILSWICKHIPLPS